MSTQEAAAILAEQISVYRKKPYKELSDRVGLPPFTGVTKNEDESAYYWDIEVFWDDGRESNVRVVANISDGNGLSAYFPMTDDFIMTPDGDFIGE